MRLVQFVAEDGTRKVGAIDRNSENPLLINNVASVYELVMDSSKKGLDLETYARNLLSEDVVNYDRIIYENRLLPPLDHPDPAHFLISGTGLDHLGSAMARNAMHELHSKETAGALPETDSMKIFNLGLQGGKPKPGEIGVQPEWFYKGDGSWVVPPGQPLEIPSFSKDMGEEAEVAGLYVISADGKVIRVGYALGNEASDHVLEKQNYLYLAHSKLRNCSFGPELLLGNLPESISGNVKIIRNGEALWNSIFTTGETNMTHNLANLEYHHFKYKQFRRPGDVHCHFFGASVLSFSDGIVANSGDVFEISAPEFGRPLRNPLQSAKTEEPGSFFSN